MKWLSRLPVRRALLLVVLVSLMSPVLIQAGPVDQHQSPPSQTLSGPCEGPGGGGGAGGTDPGPYGHSRDGDPDDYGLWLPVLASLLVRTYFLIPR